MSPPSIPLLFSPYTHLPHPAFSETQPLPHTILTTHVLHRGFQSGALLALPFASAEYLYRRRQGLPPSPSPASSPARGPHNLSTSPGVSSLNVKEGFSSLLLRRAGMGAVIGTGFMVPGLFMRMRGREEIEWADRSWRLLENEGQMEVDGWSCLGMLAGGGWWGFGKGLWGPWRWGICWGWGGIWSHGMEFGGERGSESEREG
ncbi:hypothetical protein BDZ85DRAFT_279468 [Elsinoe ampelina]|uniref:Uncharacterized protein n=1 Tax=Elsinoe ampelina TaxID=302913 RepID=A0A6A6GJJ7_9PEZI|nr:hypothetical protein BDZ85DRAFT_279468 [Elsinoe ampelina]